MFTDTDSLCYEIKTITETFPYSFGNFRKLSLYMFYAHLTY